MDRFLDLVFSNGECNISRADEPLVIEDSFHLSVVISLDVITKKTR
jgi:hypothetical protein